VEPRLHLPRHVGRRVRRDTGGVPTLEDVYEVTPDSSDEHQIQWGQATTVHGAWFYVYGTRAKGNELSRELYVARVSSGDPRGTAAAGGSGAVITGNRPPTTQRR